jgi:hypothetical protein
MVRDLRDLRYLPHPFQRHGKKWLSAILAPIVFSKLIEVVIELVEESVYLRLNLPLAS